MKSIIRKVAFFISATLLIGACTTDESGDGDGYTPPVMAEAVTNLALESKYETAEYQLPYIDVTWDYENGTDNVSELEIYCVEVGGDTSSATPVESYTSSISSITSYTISSGLTAGKSYDVWILTKMTSDDSGTKSDVRRIAAIGVDFVPIPAEVATITDLDATYESSTSKIAVTWKYDDGVENITKLTLYYSESNGTDGTVATTVTSDFASTTSFVITSGLTGDTTYYVWIETQNDIYPDVTIGDVLSITAKGENTITYDISYNSVDDVYEITSEKGLIAFNDLVNGAATNSAGASLGGSISFTSTAQTAINAKLVESVTLADDWTPMSSYSGTFDGNGKTITNLKFTASATAQGFIASLSGTVKDLKFSNPVISTGYNQFGVVAGASTGTVSGCTLTSGSVTSTVSATAYSGNGFVGGFVGYNNGGTVISCTNESTEIKAESAASVGGIVGQSKNTGAVIESCENNAKVTGNYTVGGVVGYAFLSTNYCSNSGTVTGNGQYIGGIAGINQGTALGSATSSLDDCSKNTGDVYGYQYVGGIAGNNANAATYTIKYYINEGNVSGTMYVGGLAGQNNGVISYSQSSGTVTLCSEVGGATTATASADIGSASDYLGRLVGKSGRTETECSYTGN